MSNHMPECPHVPGDYLFGAPIGCICPELRAYEQRVRDEIAADGPWFRSVVHQCCEDKHTAYAAGVQAARDAVAAEMDAAINVCGECTDVALAAIDALRGESNV